MSISRGEVKLVLPRVGCDPIWALLLEEYAGANPARMRHVSMLVLREHCGWPTRHIGRALAVHSSLVRRACRRVKRFARDSLDVETNPHAECGHGVWAQLLDDYARGCPLRTRQLAMLALREEAGWTLAAIGLATGHAKGHVSRVIRATKQRLRREHAPGKTFSF